MGPFDEVIFHISGFEGGLISKLVSGGGGKRSTYLGDCVTVNIVTDNAEEDEFVKIKIEEAEINFDKRRMETEGMRWSFIRGMD